MNKKQTGKAFIGRTISGALEALARQFPAVQMTGPRQSGKTTLAKACFPNLRYTSLENIDERQFASSDPRGFLASRCANGAVLDEIQHVPGLLSYLQEVLDAAPRNGRFVLTGSQGIKISRNVSQSLAGRVGRLTLLPLTMQEAYGNQPPALEEILWRGFYPRLHTTAAAAATPSPPLHYRNYIDTYIKRDVAGILSVDSISKFNSFLGLCAASIGQPVNAATMARNLGVDRRTIDAWLSILQESHIIFLLKPATRYSQQVRKQPKLHFHDSGLACHLLGIRSPDDLAQAGRRTLRGLLFEGWVASEALKMLANRNHPHGRLRYWRDRSGREVDLVFESGERAVPIEVKSGATLSNDHFKHLLHWKKEVHPTDEAILVYGGHESLRRSGVQVLDWKSMHALERALLK